MPSRSKPINFHIEGLDALEAAFDELPRATARNVARRALKKAAEPIKSHAEREAPDDPKTPPLDLKTSIEISTRLSNPRGKSEFANEMAFSGDRAAASAALVSARRTSKFKGSPPVVMMFVGPAGAPARYGSLQEFGTINHKAQPFMTPAWEGNKDRALKIVIRELKMELSKAVARIANKARRAGGG